MSMDYDAWRALLVGERLPSAIVDLAAFDANAARLLAPVRAAGRTVRPATKSLRVPELMRRVARLAGPLARGWMTFSATETAWLHTQGFDDFLLAYPPSRSQEVVALAGAAAAGASVVVAIDSAAHVDLIAGSPRHDEAPIDVCLDLDMSWRPLGGRVHLGVRRSPIRTVAEAVGLAARARRAGLRVRAVLAYEAQVAGMPDRTPGSRHLDPVRRLIKTRSIQLAAERRAAVVGALRDDGHLIDIVNGGGTGSVSSTSRDPACTEVTVGSGFVCPHLFDGYRGLRLEPAAFFALAVARRSDPDHVTCASGGFIASGPPAVDRQPVVVAPSGLAPLAMEGYGEVQTPLTGRGAAALTVGDPVIFRHAKAGELFERFGEVLLVEHGAIRDRVPTYRGAGQVF